MATHKVELNKLDNENLLSAMLDCTHLADRELFKTEILRRMKIHPHETGTTEVLTIEVHEDSKRHGFWARVTDTITSIGIDDNRDLMF